MDINKLKGNSSSAGKTSRSNAASGPSKAGSGGGAAVNKSSDARSSKPAANISLSGSEFESELSFAQNILSNSRKESFSSLNKIRQKINAGTYQTEEVHNEIGSMVTKDLSKLESLFQAAESAAAEPAALTDERKQYLLDNPEVTQHVADRVAEQLENI